GTVEALADGHVHDGLGDTDDLLGDEAHAVRDQVAGGAAEDGGAQPTSAPDLLDVRFEAGGVRRDADDGITEGGSHQSPPFRYPSGSTSMPLRDAKDMKTSAVASSDHTSL